MSDPTPASVTVLHSADAASVLQLRTFGGLSLTRDGRPVQGSGAQPGRVAILAAIARSATAGISRDKIIGLFWPDSSQDKAKASLRQSLYALRRDASVELVTGTTDLRLNSTAVWSDVYQFEIALAAGDLESAALLYSGSFLDGVYLRAMPEFERWAAHERAMLNAQYVDALVQLAGRASKQEDSGDAVRWNRLLSATDTTNGKFACQFMEALAADGQSEAAVRYADTHASATRRELGVEPDPAVTALAERLRVTRGIAVPVVLTASRPSNNDERQRAPADEQRVRGRDRRATKATTRVGVAIAALALVFTALSLANAAHRSAPIRRAMRAIDIVPFVVTGSNVHGDSSVHDLGRVVAVMLADQLRADSIIGSVTIDRPAATAESRAGDHLVRGTMIVTPDLITIEASVVDTTQNQLAPAITVSAPRDSLGPVVAAIAERLLAIEADARLSRSELLASKPLGALREYAAGKVLLAHGQYDDAASRFERALTIDSTFVYAALGLQTASVSDAAAYRQSSNRALEIAWRSRDALPTRDRALVLALAGPRYPKLSPPQERIGAWKAATEAAPEYAETWYGLGDVYFHSGSVAGLSNSVRAAKVAFERALEVDDRYLPALQHLVDVSVHLRDTAAARRYTTRYLSIDSTGAAATYVRWRLASLTGDWKSAPRFAGAPMLATRWLIEIAPEDGLGMEAAWSAIASRDARPDAPVADRVETALARHALALNEGRRSVAGRARGELAALEPTDTMDLRFPVLAALYGDGDDAGAAAAARDLSDLFSLDDLVRERVTLPVTVTSRDDRLETICIVGQWRAAKGDSAFAAAAARLLWKAKTSSSRVGDESEWCSRLLRATIDPSPTLALVDSLDAAVASGIHLRRNGLSAAQATARQFMRAGDPVRALRAVRRRGYFGRWPYYLATSLREESAYAIAAGDTNGAACALDLFVALRAHAEPPLAPDVAAATRQRAALRARPACTP